MTILSCAVRCIGFLLAANLVSCLYTATDDVIELTSDNFKSDVLESDDIWLVEFYAPWCGHCKSLAPEWKKAATYLKGYVKVAAVDATEHEDIGAPYGIQGFPTIKVFSGDKQNPTDFQGGRKAKDIVSAGFKEIKQSIRNRMGLKDKKKKKKKGSAVVTLTESNFAEEVMGSDDLWLVEFYAPWCGHCKNLAPHWKKAAQQLEGKVKLGAVDATVHSNLAGQYEVKGYPTIKVFAKGPKSTPQDYQGGRDTNGIVNYALRLLGQAPASGQAADEDDGETSVITLTDQNFKESVLDSDDSWMVEFFAPWCGHCKSLAPHWKGAAKELEGKVKLGAVDCTVEKVICEKHEVKGFPTIISFPKSSKDAPEPYAGGRVQAAIVSHAMDMYQSALAPVEVVQLLSEDTLKSACEEQTMCLVAFLPNILDTGADGRNKYIEMLNAVAERHKKSSLGFLWSEGFAQQKLEESVRVGGSGYPAAVIISLRKNAFVPFAGQFSADSLKSFVTGVQIGKLRSIKAPNGFPAPVSVEEWDGKDGVLPTDDDDDYVGPADGHEEL